MAETAKNHPIADNVKAIRERAREHIEHADDLSRLLAGLPH